MIQCQNCGQVTAQAGNFCRFCGTKFLPVQISGKPDFDRQPPSPYSWKTDEFQVADAPRQRNRQINQVQPLAAPKPFAVPQPPQPLTYQKPQPPLNLYQTAHCPRCASQFIKYEKKISTAGWIVFAVLLVAFFPLFWIGLLIKEDVRICQSCNYRLV